MQIYILPKMQIYICALKQMHKANNIKIITKFKYTERA